MKKWYTRITLFPLLCALAVLGMLFFLVAERNSPAEVRYTLLVLLLPVVLGMVVADLILRKIIKRLLWLWVVEIVLLLAAFYVWIVME
ncbi:hypothetical protein [Aridibaculum aurantiacum]|uniref:hypothetical protein n=1 Tax=Aridibaculum aurantiacum TaxID=2810307 RepID=UPI001A95A216|nr:hypothetical protein [Aridibaculum aurantiacum]